MKHLPKFFRLLPFVLASCTLLLASSTLFAQVVPTGGGGDPKGTIPRITTNTNTAQTNSNSSSVLTQAINFIIKPALVYGATYLVERLVSKLFPAKKQPANSQKQSRARTRITDDDLHGIQKSDHNHGHEPPTRGRISVFSVHSVVNGTNHGHVPRMTNKNDSNELTKKLRGIGKQMVLKALNKHSGDIEKVAKALKITKSELLEIMRRYGIKI